MCFIVTFCRCGFFLISVFILYHTVHCTVLIFQKRKLFDLREPSMGVKFFLSFDPIHNHLMVSLPAEKIILRVNLDFWPVKVDILAGQNGRSCRGNGVCGDEGLAKEATLSYPKVNRQQTINF